MTNPISPLQISSYSTAPKRILRPAARPGESSPQPQDGFVPGSTPPPRELKSKPNATPPKKLRKVGLWTGLTLGVVGGAALVGGMMGKPGPAPQTPKADTSVPVVLNELQGTELDNRQGQLLGPGKILKFDQYPGLHTQSLGSGVEGAPNFRGVEDRGVYGVAQPTIEGLRTVLDQLGAKDDTVAWTTMREEPVVYIQGRSYSLRTQEHPFANLEEYPGISTEQLERQEQQLKQEVLTEALKNGGRILLHGESPDGSVTQDWVSITPDQVQTPTEVFNQMKAEGYKVDYARIPVTDEQTPENQDFDALLQRITGLGEGTKMIFNCHAGRGRTTTAMVVADMVRWRQENPEMSLRQNQAVREDIKEQGETSRAADPSGRYQRGEYKSILSMIQILENGIGSKSETDAAIDRYDHVQNLREAIEKYKQRHEAGKEGAEERGLHYLNRYFQLINFDNYLKEQAPKGFEKSFEEWNQEQQQLQQLRETMELAMRPAPASGAQYA